MNSASKCWFGDFCINSEDCQQGRGQLLTCWYVFRNALFICFTTDMNPWVYIYKYTQRQKKVNYMVKYIFSVTVYQNYQNEKYCKANMY